MTEPAFRATNLQKLLDDFTKEAYGRSGSESIKQNICVMCGQPATKFMDELSRREFAISGLCQKCQDIAFADPDEEEY